MCCCFNVYSVNQYFVTSKLLVNFASLKVSIKVRGFWLFCDILLSNTVTFVLLVFVSSQFYVIFCFDLFWFYWYHNTVIVFVQACVLVMVIKSQIDLMCTLKNTLGDLSHSICWWHFVQFSKFMPDCVLYIISFSSRFNLTPSV